MASWTVEDLGKEIKDLEMIYQRNNGSALLPRMKDSLTCKIEGVHVFTPSTFVGLSDAVEKSMLPAEMKAELQSSLEAKAACALQGPTRLQVTPQSMTMPWNYLSQSEWQQLQSGISNIE